MSGGTFNVDRSIWDDPAFIDEPLSPRGALLWLASKGRIVRADIRDLAKAWVVTERRAAQIVKRLVASGSISVSGSGACRIICVETRLVSTCGFHVTPRASRPRKIGGGKWRGSSLSKSTREAVIARDGGKCVYCGSEGPAFHIDHVKPVSAGGTDKMSNLATACATCNLRKGARALGEWKP